MAKKTTDLIIVESPTKARTLTKFLKGKYEVTATMGHIRDLPKASLGVDVDHDFTPKYIVPKAKSKQVTELKHRALKATNVILATDPDREGEAIAWHVSEILSDEVAKKRSKTKTPSPRHPVTPSRFKRIVFHEITEHAITEALTHPREIDHKLVDAQQARRVLDRLVGYSLSPLLWRKLSKRWLSAGRVQSVAVRLIVEREREIKKFQKKEYWTIEGEFTSALRIKKSQMEANELSRSQENIRDNSSEIRAQLVLKDGEKYEQTLKFDLFDGQYTTTSSLISDQLQASSIIKDLKDPFTVSAVDKKEVKRYPSAPYTTSTLQQDAGRKLYFSSKKTMQLAQKLYEEGLITYHRTDSVNLSEKFIGEARTFIQKEYGTQYIPAKPKAYHTKSKVAQEAHEAIRPTNVDVHGGNLTDADLNRDHGRLYELIWKRAMASQASEAVFDSTTIVITSANTYQFEAQGSVIKFDGFLKITGREIDEVIMPNVAVGQTVVLAQTLPEQKFTSPPPRYTEASLVKTLEEKDIGRPSTYAPIISTVQERQYVTREEKKLVPTELGFAVTDFLVKYFPDIMELPFTAKMEGELDKIAGGQQQWVPVIAEFYGPFASIVEKTHAEAEKVKIAEEQIDEACPDCKNPLVVRMGKFGKFIACSTFPDCKYTRQFVEKAGIPCPKCGADIVIKKTRRGKTFYGCGNYPTCSFAAWKKEDIK